MTWQELNSAEKRRFTHNNTCPLCSEKIDDFDQFSFVVRKRRRCKEYTFFHNVCLEKAGIEYEKEKQICEKTKYTKSS